MPQHGERVESTPTSQPEIEARQQERKEEERNLGAYGGLFECGGTERENRGGLLFSRYGSSKHLHEPAM